jgi:hypothetical protein
MTNFDFLKPLDKNLYNIITDAEKLYRDEYFEQSITQTRRFGEAVCKIILGEKSIGLSFDDMLATLKDKAISSIQEKEFIDDLYFIKREGNTSIHSTTVKKDGIIALECLQRAFEVAINYAVHFRKSNSSLLKFRFDTELLVTGKKNKKSLSERYIEEKEKNKSTTKTKNKSNRKKTTKITYKEKNKTNLFKIFLFISSIISIILVFTIFLVSFAL